VKVVITFAVCVLLSCAWLHADVQINAQSDLGITRSGPPAAELELPADLLRRYLLRVLGKDDLAGAGSKVTFTLHADSLTWHSLPHPLNLRDIDAFSITVTDSPTPEIRIAAGTVLGVSYGVLQFLEDDLGVTWLFPGELGLSLPEQRSFSLAPGTRRLRPALVSRFYTGMKFGEPAQMATFRKQFAKGPLYAQRHFFESYDYFKSLKLHGLIMPSHNMINIFPPQQMMAEHPDVMPMLADGQRYQPPAPSEAKPNDHQHWHPCYTNPATVKLAIDAARAGFARGEMCFSLGINDGLRQQCQCEACKSVGWPASYYQFVTSVAQAVQDAYPPRMVGVLVYGDVRHPSEDLRLPPNVFANVSMGSAMEPWSRRASQLGRYEYFYGRGFGIPSVPLKSMQHNAAVYERLGIASMRAEAHPVWAFDAPKIYVHTRLMWDPSQDAAALVKRWCNAAFGPGGEAIARLYLHWAAKFDYLVKPGSPEPAPLVDMGMWRSSSAQYQHPSAADYDVTFACLDEAQRLVTTQPQKDRLAMIRAHFELSRAEWGIYHQVQRLYDGGSSATPQDALTQLSELARQRDDATKQIDANPQWLLAGGDIERRAGWSLDKEMQSGLITSVVRMRRAGPLQAKVLASIPEQYRPYAAAATAMPARRIKILRDSGTYWALETSRPRFKPMDTQVIEGGFRAVSDGVNDLVAEGSMAGQYREHWAYALYPTQPNGKRQLFEVTLRASGRSGVLSLDLSNPWRVAPGDGVPVQTCATLADAGGTLQRTLVVEPVDPTSASFDKSFQFRVALLWSPNDDAAQCRAEVTIVPMELADQP
jgi:hypothetical protein